MDMPQKIKILSDSTINKIAAGEVIENSASVVKELVENALDAEASQITVEILSGGRQLIRVTDNGCGMSRDDVLLCLERHATSKIEKVDDLETLTTMGFRGEALPSIASISQFSITTCAQDALEGTYLQVEGGKILSCQPAGRATGTTIEVANLFYNVPARKKFQKSIAHDTTEIHKLMGSLALAHPSHAFRLITQGEEVLTTHPVAGIAWKDQVTLCVQEVLGKEFLDSLIPIDVEDEQISLRGFLGTPHYTRHNRTGQHLFINHRSVSSALVAAAVLEGYGMRLEPRRYPVFLLYWSLPSDCVDVNVHPQKKEVRLHRERFYREKIVSAVNSTLSAHLAPTSPFNAVTNQAGRPYPPSIFPPRPSFSFSPPPPAFYPNLPVSEKSNAPPSPPPQVARETNFYHEPPLPWETTPALLSEKKAPLYATPKALAVLAPYVVLDRHPLALPEEKFPGIALLDIRACRARILFEQLINQQNPCASQLLLLPITLELSKLEAECVLQQLPFLEHMGFGLRTLGGNTFAIDALPSHLDTEDPASFFQLLLADLQQEVVKNTLELDRERNMAKAANRLATASPKRMSLDEGQALLEALLKCKTPFQCPFGRPTIANFSPNDLEKKFEHI